MIRDAGRRNRVALTATALVLCLSACKLLVHLYAGRHYGYFVDELYYLACSRHLAWGYVDQPPLIALITWLARSLFGDSLPAIRFLPAVAGAGEVALTALIARELGGNRFAQGSRCRSRRWLRPGILAADNLLSMNAFEPLFWMGCAWLLIRMVKTGDQKLWIWFGILAGFGLENKYSMLIFGAGMVVGLLLTPAAPLASQPLALDRRARSHFSSSCRICCGTSSITSRSWSYRPISAAAGAMCLSPRWHFSLRRF